MTRFSVYFVSLAFVLSARASAHDAHYYPRVSGPPTGVVVGRLTDIGFGNGSGGLKIRTAAGKTIDLYTARPPFMIDGKAIECPQPPKRGFRPTHEDCPHWPSQVVVGRSEVRVPYWRGKRYGKPTLIAAGLQTVHR